MRACVRACVLGWAVDSFNQWVRVGGTSARQAFHLRQARRPGQPTENHQSAAGNAGDGGRKEIALPPPSASDERITLSTRPLAPRASGSMEC